MTRICAVLLSLALACCGGGPSVDYSTAEIAYVYTTEPVGPGWYGLLGVTWRTEAGVEVHIRDDMDPALVPWWSVLAHELWHVAGFRTHLAPPCTSAPSAQDALDAEGPCEEELAAMAGVVGPILLVCEDDPTLLVHLHFACRWWNEALGRDLFVVAGDGS